MRGLDVDEDVTVVLAPLYHRLQLRFTQHDFSLHVLQPQHLLLQTGHRQRLKTFTYAGDDLTDLLGMSLSKQLSNALASALLLVYLASRKRIAFRCDSADEQQPGKHLNPPHIQHYRNIKMIHRQVLKALSSTVFISKYYRMKISLCSFIVVISLLSLGHETNPPLAAACTVFGRGRRRSVLSQYFSSTDRVEPELLHSLPKRLTDGFVDAGSLSVWYFAHELLGVLMFSFKLYSSSLRICTRFNANETKRFLHDCTAMLFNYKL